MIWKVVCVMSNKKEFLNLGKQPIANKFLRKNEFEDEFFYNLKVVFDDDTKLVSLKDFVKPELMFNEDYVYHTSLSVPMVEHFKNTAEMLMKEFNPLTVMEIGSNDGAFLKNWPNDYSIGVEPCDNFANVTEDMGYQTYSEFWTTELSEKIKNDGHVDFDLIYAANCICHIQNLDECFAAVKNILSKNGVFVFEDPSLLRMLERGSYDQIYDEHAHIFSVTALDNILMNNGLKIFRVDNLSVHGGSNRVYVSHLPVHTFLRVRPVEISVRENLNKEKEFGIDNFKTYEIFAERIDKLDIFSEDQDDFATSIFSEIIPTKLDKEGRFLIPENLKLYSNISNEVTFIGQGHYFQIWEPEAATKRQKKSRERLVREKRTLGSILTSSKNKNG